MNNKQKVLALLATLGLFAVTLTAQGDEQCGNDKPKTPRPVLVVRA